VTTNLHSGPVEPVFYSVRQIAGILGINYITAKRAVLSREIPSVRVGRRVLIPMRWVEQTIENAIAAQHVPLRDGAYRIPVEESQALEGVAKLPEREPGDA
jgi:excisionase family DNA binding protein